MRAAGQILGVISALVLAVDVSERAVGQNVRAKTITRVFWHDRETQAVSWADVVAESRWRLKRGPQDGLPQLDPDTQRISDLAAAGESLMVAVRPVGFPLTSTIASDGLVRCTAMAGILTAVRLGNEIRSR